MDLAAVHTDVSIGLNCIRKRWKDDCVDYVTHQIRPQMPKGRGTSHRTNMYGHMSVKL